MKFIVNSSLFAHKIAEAISEGMELVKCSDGHQVTFEHPYMIIDIPVHYMERQSWDLKFDIFQWFRIVEVLRKIPEQPITVEITDDSIAIFMEYVFRTTVKP